MSNTSEPITVVSGIPPDDSGTGRMMRQLIARGPALSRNMRFIHKARPKKPVRALVKARDWASLRQIVPPYLLGQAKFYLQFLALMLSGSGKILIMHPQTLGFGATSLLMRRWPSGKAFLYVLDSSYFCVRSYNHIEGERDGCLRCLGGDSTPSHENGCKPWPVANPRGFHYVETLHALGRVGKVKFLSQNETQAKLLRRHFGADASIEVVGLWGEDWTSTFDKRDELVSRSEEPNRRIVIHSFYVEAKGAKWFLDLASRCPDIEFFCPFPKAASIKSAPPNVIFKRMTWESGLQEIVCSAYMVVVPSLWSAPIEGALVKTLAVARRVATIDNPSAFQSELPERLVLRLSSDPGEAGRQLYAAIGEDWRPDPAVQLDWLTQFQARNKPFVENVVQAISGDQHA